MLCPLLIPFAGDVYGHVYVKATTVDSVDFLDLQASCRWDHVDVNDKGVGSVDIMQQFESIRGGWRTQEECSSQSFPFLSPGPARALWTF